MQSFPAAFCPVRRSCRHKNNAHHWTLENIYTRIGIDVGENDETLWHLAGMQACSEVTTCSLHTSLAAHMQNAAKPNGIMVGNNVKTLSGLGEELFNIRKNADGIEDRYCFSVPEDNYYYTQWNFEWAEYLQLVEAAAAGELSTQVEGAANVAASVAAGAAAGSGLNLPYLRQQAFIIKPYSE